MCWNQADWCFKLGGKWEMDVFHLVVSLLLHCSSDPWTSAGLNGFHGLIC